MNFDLLTGLDDFFGELDENTLAALNWALSKNIWWGPLAKFKPMAQELKVFLQLIQKAAKANVPAAP